MTYKKRYAGMGAILLLLALTLLQEGCKKEVNTPDQSVTQDPVPHYGWHDQMTGKLFFTLLTSSGVEQELLYVMDEQELRQIILPDTFPWIYGIGASPDGAWIAFGEWEGLFVVDVDNGSMDNPYNVHECFEPSWSPDGSDIAFISFGKDIVIMDHESGDCSVFEHTPMITGLNWSSNDNILLYFKYGGNKPGLYVFNIQSGNRECIGVFGGYRYKWSPDDTKIAFIQEPGLYEWEVVTILADGTGSRIIFNTGDQGLDCSFRDLAWSPDGHMLAVGADDGIYIVDQEGRIISKIKTFNLRCSNIDWK